VFGPLLFVLCINDLPDQVDSRSEAYLFADDTKIFRIITGENDHNILQEDLQKMEYPTVTSARSCNKVGHLF
jgi:hypothetical protein